MFERIACNFLFAGAKVQQISETTKEIAFFLLIISKKSVFSLELQGFCVPL